MGLIRSIECRLIACIAALLPPDIELLDDVDNVGDAVPVLSAAVADATDVDVDDDADDVDEDVGVVVDVVVVAVVEFVGIGFLIMVTGCVTVVCGPFAIRLWTAALNDSDVM